MSDKSTQQIKLALLSILSAAVLGGGIPVFTKIGLKEFSPLIFLLLRFIFASIFMSFLLLKERLKINKKEVYKIILVSFLATMNVIFFTFGVKRTTAAVSQMLYAAVPIIAGIFSYLLLKEKIRQRKALGVMVGFLGVSLIILLPVIGKMSPLKGDLMGNLLVFAGVTSFSLYTVFSKKLQQKYSPTFLTAVFSLATTVILFFLTFNQLSFLIIQPKNISLAGWFSVVYVGVLGTGLYYLIYQYAIKHGTPIIASIIMYLQPIATFGWAAVLLAERLTLGFVIGGLLALTGAWLVTQK